MNHHINNHRRRRRRQHQQSTTRNNIILALAACIVAVIVIVGGGGCCGGNVGIIDVAAFASRNVDRHSSFHRQWRVRREHHQHGMYFALSQDDPNEVPFKSRNINSHHYHHRRVVILMPECPMDDETLPPSWHIESLRHLEQIGKDYQFSLLLDDYGNNEPAATPTRATTAATTTTNATTVTMMTESTTYTNYLTAVPYPRIHSYALAIGTIPPNRKKSSKKTRISPFSNGGAYFVDLCPPTDTGLGYRLHKTSSGSGSGGGGEELLIRALGIKKMLISNNSIHRSDDEPIVIYDLTAGLARDSLVILSSFLDYRRDTIVSSSSSNSQQPKLRLHMVERDPVVALLLSDALRRLNLLSNDNNDDANVDDSSFEHRVTEEERSTAQQMKQCLSMEEGDGVSVLNRLMLTTTTTGKTTGSTTPIPSTSAVPYPPDICYLDPMFPPRKKQKSAVKKDMAMLHSLLGTAEVVAIREIILTEGDSIASGMLTEVERLKEERDLLLAACNVAKKRVVVKRPIGAKPLGLVASDQVYEGVMGDDDDDGGDKSRNHFVDVPKPSYDVRGSVNRFDVYLIQ